MSLSVGDQIGPYEILAAIGAGGMGEVYKARDTRLDRIVAIKISRKEFSERFEREARAVAALNHPHICTLYDIGPNYLVFEYVEGEPLKGPLPLDKALDYAAQICDALDAAHSKKITHRDLKPANILVTKQGVKLLDFGLAKIDKPGEVGQETVTMALTSQGQILGTLLYMSPEQLQGKEADSRSDIFSFGCVLYEILTGKRAFDGASPASVIAAILERPGPSVVDVAPPTLDRVLKRCFEKDPENRWQSARDLKAALDMVGGVAELAPFAPSRSRGSQKHGWIFRALAAVLAVVALGLGFIAYQHSREEPASVLRFGVPLPDQGKTSTNQLLPAISPDGKHVVFANFADEKRMLWVRDLDSFDARPLPGTEGGLAPFWSPDSKTVAFFASNKIKRVDIAGGSVATISDSGGVRGGSWAPGRDLIVFANLQGTFQVSAAGGTPAAVTKLDQAAGESSHIWPSFLPDGNHFLVSVLSGKEETRGVYAADLRSATKVRVLPGADYAMYANGYLLFGSNGTLRARAFDPDKLELTGEVFTITDGLDTNRFVGSASFSVSQNGRLTYISAGSGITQFTWFDRTGRQLGRVGPFSEIRNWPALSSDGSLLALGLVQNGDNAIWLHDLARGTTSRFTFGGNGSYPVWSPDGRALAFGAERNGLIRPVQKPLDAGAEDALGPASDAMAYNLMPESWSRDGRYLVERVIQAKTADDVWIQPLFGDRKPFPYLQSPANERNASISPDGKWLLYSSDETGRTEVYVQSFPEPGGKVQISPQGGDRAQWSYDGKEIFFIALDRSMMAVSIRSGSRFEASKPAALFDSQIAGAFNNHFAVSKDGRLLVPTLPEQSTVAQLNVIVNWPAGFKK